MIYKQKDKDNIQENHSKKRFAIGKIRIPNEIHSGCINH